MKIEVTSGSIKELMSRRGVRGVTKIFLVLIATSLSTVFFGLISPFFMLSMEILPPLGVAGIIYLVCGGAFGLLFGSISTAVSLKDSEAVVTRYYVVLMGLLSAFSLLYVVSYLYLFPETLQRHL